MRASEITIPSATGSAPPERPDPGAARDERDPVLVAGAHDRAPPPSARLRQRHQRRHDAAAGQAVALVGAQLLGTGDQLVRARSSAPIAASAVMARAV